MKKVFIIHGFDGSPNGGWRPWLMGELAKQNVYACALSMPTPAHPICAVWVDEILRHIQQNVDEDIYLIGHSLGVPTILRCLEGQLTKQISGAILVSGRIEKNNNKEIDSFLDKKFDFEKIKLNCEDFIIIHGDNDPNVPLDNARFLSKELNCELIIVENGGHLNGSAGWTKLPQCLEAFEKIMK